MKTVTVDPQRRVRLGEESPETKFWVIAQPNGYFLQRIHKPEALKQPTKEEALAAIEKHSVHFKLPCSELMKLTREIDWYQCYCFGLEHIRTIESMG
jgi:hypothetical protein